MFLSLNNLEPSTGYFPPVISTPAGSAKESAPLVGITDKTASGDRTEKAAAKGECQTCKERKYIDGSDEGNVSFQAPGHIAPEASANVVMSHEKEHVANARREGNKPGNELVSATVSLKTAICPECGRSYVAGGTTRTLIRYSNSEYGNNKKAFDRDALLGANVDTKV